MTKRRSSYASFWDERFQEYPGMFGTMPNPFIHQHADRIKVGDRVLELGAGEGRNAIFLAKEREAVVTAMDFSPEALDTAAKHAAGLNLTTSERFTKTLTQLEYLEFDSDNVRAIAS